MRGGVRTVGRWLQDRMPVDVSTAIGYTALHLAIPFNQTDDVKHLLHAGADVNRQDLSGNTPLHGSALHNNTEVARLLINEGADINLPNKSNETPLDKAHEGTEVKHLLVELQQKPP